jgi:16S rRNA (uracil1498-N3)-methyltransferase
MPAHDFRTPRLYVDAPLAGAGEVTLNREQANYLRNALRCKDGDSLLLFNGRDGEWQARLAAAGRRSFTANVETLARPQPPVCDLHLLFAPLKHARLDYMVQKAVEMGASRLQPVMTRHTQVARINLARMRANAIEAAQQCGVLALPEVAAPLPFDRMIATLEAGRFLIFCDEIADVRDPLAALKAGPAGRPLAVLVGPEGGFAQDERRRLLDLPHVIRLALGPRILRADTAAVAALALVQASLGDWRGDRIGVAAGARAGSQRR